MDLDATTARRVRLRSLLLEGSPRAAAGGPGAAAGATGTVASVVEWFGAMQAQDHGSGLWSLGCRVPGSTRADIEAAVERGEVLRTWPMRGTIHLVPPTDAGWMLELTGSIALAQAAGRRAQLGLTADEADRATEALAAALSGGRRLVRAECVDVLAAAGIDATGQRAYHLLWYASQQGVTCIGPHRGKEQTYVLLDEWAPDRRRLDREAALATLATRYVRSHGPVPRQDLAGWTGLPAAAVREALALAGDAVAEVRVDGREMYADPAALDALPTAAAGPRALAGFDEYLLGYKDRSLMAGREVLGAVVPGGNGVFRWTLTLDGRVVATWQRRATARRVAVEVNPLVPLTAGERSAAEAALAPYGAFVGLPLTIAWADGPA
jgi:hypothetical protein